MGHKIAIVTDSNSGITQEQAKELGIIVIAMPFFIDEQVFYEGTTITAEEFYTAMEANKDIKTSMPSPADVVELWEELLKEYDEIVYIPMSSALSSSCETAIALAAGFDGRVQVIDNLRISITQRQSAIEAYELAEAGKSAAQIKKILEDHKMDASIYITVNTLKYLKKGGRVTPAAAAIGTVLNIKPVLKIQGKKLDAFSKARGIKQSKKIMLDAMERDINSRFAGREVVIMAAYTCSDEEAANWQNEIEERFKAKDILINKLALSIGCHTGPGAVAIACTAKLS